MRCFSFFCLLFILPQLGLAQIGNEWINFGQTYYKIPVAKDGIYKVTKADLAQAGMPVEQVDPRRLQVFHRGIEQALVVQHQQSPADAIFDDNEFFEFYGKKNDGTLDAALYKPSSLQPHTFYNLFNDTAYYFLTVNPLAQGKRMASFTQLNTEGLAAETHQLHEQMQLFTNSYASGESFNFVQLTSFGRGEGWSGPVLRENTNTDLSFTGLTNGVTAGGSPSIELQLLGRGFTSHAIEIYVGPSAGALRLANTQSFFGFDALTFQTPLNWTDISGTGTMIVRVRILGSGSADFVSISYAKITYPRSFNMNGEPERLFQLESNAGSKSYIEIANAPVNTRLFDITDSNNVIQIGTTQSATLNAIVNNTQASRKLWAGNQVISPANIKRVSFRSFANTRPEFLIISHKVFQKPALGSANPLRAYASYRASAVGGGYDTLTVTIDQLYNQFSYGESTPLALFRFLKYLEGLKRPDYLFIIGKGLDVSTRYYRNPSAFPVYKDLVPSAGLPASDMYYSVGLSDPNTNEPGIPTGRLSVTRPEQVIQYLNKVIEQEANANSDLWPKRLLHLSGGIAEGEPETFKGYMEDFASVAEDLYLGASVTSIAKRSLEAQELINISKEVNEGLGLITFFGHSSTSTTDFDIGFATNAVLGYNNKGKYPMLLINGCNAGDFFGNGILFGEDWVNASERGAVGFIAHSSFGLVATLKRYSDIFYQVAYGDSTFLKSGIGNVQKEVARRYLQNAFLNTANISQVQQMVLLGDPAVKLFGAEKADYHVESSALMVSNTSGRQVNSLSEAIQLKLIVKNFGRAESKALRVRVNRTLADNSVLTYDSLFNPVFYQDTITFIIPNTQEQAGTNQFEILIDADDEVKELREDNNRLSYELFIPVNGTRNLFPQPFALVNAQEQMLVFQGANLLDSLRAYQVEIDTTHLFNSGWKQSYTVQAKVLAKQPVTLLPNDSISYYWRTRLLNPATEESRDWESNSFTYIPNTTEGWGQMNFPQYLENETDDLLLDEDQRQISFTETVTPVLIKTFGDLNTSPATEVSVKIDGAEYNLATQGQPCRDNTINLLAFNRISTVPYAAIPFNFQDPRTCGREPQVIVSFRATEVYASGINDLVQAINDVAAGDSIILFTIGNPALSTWHPEVINKLAEVGISNTQLAGITDGEPFVLYGKKGAAAGGAALFTAEIAPAIEQELVVNRQITGRKASGSMTTQRIGPALAWKQLKWQAKLRPNDVVGLTIKGLTTSGVSIVLMENVVASTDLSFIDATIYPYLELTYNSTDDASLTPAQLDYWLVEYETLPEGMLVLNETYATQTLQEGEAWTQSMAFTNISSKYFSDSLQINYNVINRDANSSEALSLKIQSPAPGDTAYFTLISSTIKKPALNDVQVMVNPRLQPELFYENNEVRLTDAFSVAVDQVSPVLSVTVDGRLLEQEDFVSSNPSIVVQVWDENQLILKTDTTDVLILLTYPEETTPQQIYFNRSDVVWKPATASEAFTVFFNPVDLPAGDYTLQVKAGDARGNSSGQVAYEVDFKVSSTNETSLSKPYPNPTDGLVYFTLDIRGSEIPAGAWLEIMNPMGKLIYETGVDTSQYHVGRNYISLPLAHGLTAGLYLYRIRFANGLVQRGQLVLTR